MAIEIAIGGALEIYDSGVDWAKVRCTNGAAPDWTTEVVVDGDGLESVSGVVTSPHEQGFTIHWNGAQASNYRTLVITHGGGSGQVYGDVRSDLNGGIDWANLQSAHGCLIVSVKWHASSDGRWSRPSAAPVTLDFLAERAMQVIQWIDDELNPLNRPLTIIGSSGGADFVLTPFTLDHALAAKVHLAIACSYPIPFYDPHSMCHEVTPAGTFVDPDTGDLGESGVGVQLSGVDLIDDCLTTGKCALQTVTEAELDGFADQDSLAAIAPWYQRTLLVTVGQAEDIANGVVWAAGNLFHHPFFGAARRRWFSSVTDGHGDALSDVTSEGFALVHEEIVRLADGILGGSMSLQLSVAVRNARLDSIETVVGTAPILRIRTGAAPADCAAANSGTVLATLTLPSDWMAAAAAGAKAKSGTWQDASADAAGTAAHFRIHDSGDVACHLQGTVTITGGGGDLTVDNPVFEAAQAFTITGFSLTDGNP